MVHLVRSLDRDRFEAMVVSLFDPVGTDLEEMLACDGVPVRYLGKRRGPDPRVYLRIARILRRFRPHVVHTHQYVLRYTLPPALHVRIPAMVHTLHNPAEKEVDRVGRLVGRIAFKRGVLPVAIAQQVADSLDRVYGIEGVPLIPNGIPIEVYRRPVSSREAWRRREKFTAEDVLFVCVARLDPQKNHALLLDAFARAFRSSSHVHLLLVGRGRLRAELEKRAVDLGVQRRVHFLGVRTDIPDILNASDAFVMSSDWEGNPLCVMEAMSARRVVIGTAVGGVPELVEDGETGLLVRKGDTMAFSQAMRHLLEHPESRRKMEEASAIRAAEHFDVNVMTKSYEELYEARLARI
jgi:glycosyltransferase involved in cell wall biosynthesis